MLCPHCLSEQVFTVNSRPTKKGMQVWRRRKCGDCGERFTTHEIADLSHVFVEKSSGKTEIFSRSKLFAGIYIALNYNNFLPKTKLTDKMLVKIEREIIKSGKKRISTGEIADLVLKELRQIDMTAFLRFLVVCKQINSNAQVKSALRKYTY